MFYTEIVPNCIGSVLLRYPKQRFVMELTMYFCEFYNCFYRRVLLKYPTCSSEIWNFFFSRRKESCNCFNVTSKMFNYHLIQRNFCSIKIFYHDSRRYIDSDFPSSPYNHWMYTNRALCYLELKQYKWEMTLYKMWRLEFQTTSFSCRAALTDGLRAIYLKPDFAKVCYSHFLLHLSFPSVSYFLLSFSFFLSYLKPSLLPSLPPWKDMTVLMRGDPQICLF